MIRGENTKIVKHQPTGEVKTVDKVYKTHFGMTSLDITKEELVEATLSKMMLAEDLDPKLKDNQFAILAVKTDPRNSSTTKMQDSSEYQVIMMTSNTTSAFKKAAYKAEIEATQKQVGNIVDIEVKYYLKNLKTIKIKNLGNDGRFMQVIKRDSGGISLECCSSQSNS